MRAFKITASGKRALKKGEGIDVFEEETLESLEKGEACSFAEITTWTETTRSRQVRALQDLIKKGYIKVTPATKEVKSARGEALQWTEEFDKNWRPD